MGVGDAILDRPRPKSGDLHDGFKRDGFVLVPGELPIAIRRLVKKQSPCWESIRSQDSLNMAENFR